MELRSSRYPTNKEIAQMRGSDGTFPGPSPQTPAGKSLVLPVLGKVKIPALSHKTRQGRGTLGVRILNGAVIAQFANSVESLTFERSTIRAYYYLRKTRTGSESIWNPPRKV
jgi:hypothetical protein